jgi:phosphotriesterase-related protein
MKVNTVLGPIPPESMGRTLIHDHFTFAYPGYTADLTIAPYDHERELKRCLEMAETLKKIGIKTILDPTTNDAHGRNPELMKEVSSKTGISIINITGLFSEHDGAPQYWLTMLQPFGKDITKMITELFIKEITEGIGKSGVKAGAIKVCSGPVLTDYEKITHIAAVNAQKATGVPIITHNDEYNGVEEAEFLLSQGADPKKVMIGHVNSSNDLNYHRAILKKGTSIGYDRMGLAPVFGFPEEENFKNIAQLIKEGFLNKIMVSQDTVLSLGRDRFADLNEELSNKLKNSRIDFICTDGMPMFKAQGITDEQIDVLMIDNPKNLFLGV